MAQDIFIPKAHLETLLKYLDQKMGDRSKALEGTGYKPESYPLPTAPVPAAVYTRVNQRGEALLEDPLFALHAGMATNAEELGWGKYAVSAQVDFRSALREAALNQNKVISPIVMSVEEDEHGLAIITTPKFKVDEVIPVYLEFMVGLGISIFSLMFGKRFVHSGVSFTHAARSDHAAYEKALGVLPRFTAPGNVQAYSNKDLDAPTILGDPNLAEMSAKEMQAQFQAYQNGSADITEVVLGILSTVNTPQDWKLEALAEKLLLPPRTLQYRLTQSGSSFMELVETVRKTRAASLLEGGVEQADIAYQLGYAEVGAFRKAFQRWHGVSPSAWQGGHAADEE